MARAILNRHEKMGDNCLDKTNDYYFPGHIKGAHFNDGSWGKLKKEIDKRSGVTGWQVRDLRRTFRSTLARLGVPREIAEIMLNHVTGAGKTDLDEIYDRYDYLPEKRAALQKLETHLKKVVVG
ncbi:integrase [Bradyrhizobium japonicum]